MTEVVPGSSPLTTEFVAHGDRLIVLLTGELDALAADSLPSAVFGAGIHIRQMVEFDIAGVTFIDSAGLRGLLVCKQAITELGANMRVVAAAAQAIRLFEVTGTAEHLGVTEPVDQVAAAIASGGEAVGPDEVEGPNSQ